MNIHILIVILLIGITDGSKACKGDWQLVFHAVSGNGESVLDTWKTKNTKCDMFSKNCPCSTTNGCLPQNLRLETLGVVPRKILRSPLIDYWDCLDVHQVKLELSTRGKTVAYIEFNGRGSNYMNWFHNSRILKTSWTDMKKSGTYNFFSIDKETRYSRKFFINQKYGGCHVDSGWFVVSDVKGRKPCEWEKQKPYPQFLYSRYRKITKWGDKKYGKADVLNIYIRRG
ncbi:uncharacterized protein LOC133192328 [Saccostrea echinata]|uniref:uncharacterized protein LOC133192328 n=1 Tax=Saccostrea echinata TaxID=191078 RepID=UPI002A816EDE|nr:uncharacterized protein LOC133192328 [Saccostrea echinata]